MVKSFNLYYFLFMYPCHLPGICHTVLIHFVRKVSLRIIIISLLTKKIWHRKWEFPGYNHFGVIRLFIFQFPYPHKILWKQSYIFSRMLFKSLLILLHIIHLLFFVTVRCLISFSPKRSCFGYFESINQFSYFNSKQPIFACGLSVACFNK